MSREKLYAKRPLRIGDKIIPLVLCGASNCTMFVRGREVLEKDWWVTCPTKRVPLYDIDEYLQGIPDDYEEFFYIGNKAISSSAFKVSMKRAMLHALTLSEMQEIVRAGQLFFIKVYYKYYGVDTVKSFYEEDALKAFLEEAEKDEGYTCIRPVYSGAGYGEDPLANEHRKLIYRNVKYPKPQKDGGFWFVKKTNKNGNGYEQFYAGTSRDGRHFWSDEPRALSLEEAQAFVKKNVRHYWHYNITIEYKEA